jgi:3-oxoacyl-[acyl-carrier-protein] synthase-3
VSQMVESVQVLLKRNGLQTGDVAMVVPHQANQRILDAVGERLGLPSERVASVLACYGNTTGATLPLALNAVVDAGRIKRGELLVFAAVGAGFTAGATLVRWC